MRAQELLSGIEQFQRGLIDHRELWGNSLEDPIPDYPVRNRDELAEQSRQLGRKVGALRSYLERFRPNWTMHHPATGTQWDALDAATSMDEIAQIKGPSLASVISILDQIIGELQALDPDDEIPRDKSHLIRAGGSASELKMGCTQMSNLRTRQVDLLRKLVETQEKVPEGQHIDFLTATSFDGTEILLPSGENLPLNRQDLDELIDQGLVRITNTRKYGDINGHVTNSGLELIASFDSETEEGSETIVNSHDLFEDPQDLPTVFISYSHDSEEHKTWVRVDLAERLMAAGVRVILDQWHLKFGADLTHFMERALRAEHVLIVCTPAYAKRANSREGGVGYEASIITAEIISQRPSIEPKFVPILREGDLDTARPDFLKSALAADLRPSNSNYESEFRRLLRQLHREPEFTPPPLGNKPSFDD